MSNNVILKDIWFFMRRFSVSWMGIFVMLLLLLVALGGYPAARAGLVVFLGVVGAYAAFRLHFGNRRVNPYLKLKRQWKMPRVYVIASVSLLALVLSTALFLEGIFMNSDSARMMGVYLASANGFFFFGAVYGIAGRLSISEARQRLMQASFDDKQRWREEIGRMNEQVSDVRRAMDAIYRLSVLPASAFFDKQRESDRSV